MPGVSIQAESNPFSMGQNMRIALIGASGRVGRPILEEALARGHDVTAIVRSPEKLAGLDVEIRRVDVLQTTALMEALREHGAVISAFSGHAQPDVLDYYVRGMRSIIEAAKLALVPRLLVVGGAGSLEVRPGVQLLDTPDFPEMYRATAEGARRALHMLREERSLNWTMLSPPAQLEVGPRTGIYRIGSDRLVVDERGQSHISLADYAVAMIDELEAPRHERRRFTVGY